MHILENFLSVVKAAGSQERELAASSTFSLLRERTDHCKAGLAPVQTNDDVKIACGFVWTPPPESDWG